VRVRAPKPAVMRRREPALEPAQIPLLLPLAVDLVCFPAEIEVQEGAEMDRIGRSRSRSRMTRGRRISGLPLHEANLGLLRIPNRNPERG
jgi:hypothetical protein